MLLSSTEALAVRVTPFGPTHYTRQSGAPVEQRVSFTADNLNGSFVLTVYNGGLQDHAALGEYVSSSTIKLNGVAVVGPENFNQNTDVVSVPVSLSSVNELSMELRGKPGGAVTVEITGEVNTAPVADAGVDRTVTVGASVALDGSASFDPDGDDLTFAWSLVARPGESNAALNGADSVSATFTADVAGEYVAGLVAGDGQLSSPQAQVKITALPQNRPPEFGPVGGRTVALGTTLILNLIATDPDGDPLSFSARPLPLPEGATLDGETGEFRFKPSAEQTGAIALTFSASDGVFTDSETVTLTVPPPDPIAATRFSGRLLDANAYAQGIETPIAGATVSFLNTAASTRSDDQGYFTLTGLPDSTQVIDIDPKTALPAPGGSGYAGFREGYELIAHVENLEERSFFLPRIDGASLTPVDPEAVTLVDNPSLGVSITVPPHTAKNPDGSDFTGNLSISLVPKGLAPAPLPDFLDPGLLVTIQPVGVTFASPVPMTFPNLDGLPPESELDLWSLDPESGAFTIVGTGRVSADGQTVGTISGGVRAADWHSLLPIAANAADDVPEKAAPTQSPCQQDQTASTSTITTLSGCLNTGFRLPGYTSQGRDRGLSFVYKAERAHPHPAIPFDATIPVRSAVPLRISYETRLGGVKLGQETFLSTSGFSERVDETLRAVAHFDAGDIDTGLYPYSVRLTNHFSGSRISTDFGDRIVVINESHSPFGAGWGLTELSRLHIQSDDALVTDGGGGTTVFNVINAGLFADFETGTLEGFVPSGIQDGFVVVVEEGTRFSGVDDTSTIEMNGSYAVNVRSSGPAPTSSVGILTSPLFFAGDQITFTQRSERTRVNIEVRLIDPNDQILISQNIPPSVGAFSPYALDTSAYRGQSVRVQFRQHTTQAGRGWYTLIDDVQATGTSSDQNAGYQTLAGDYSTLEREPDGTFTHTLKDGTQIHFDAEGLQTQVTDRNGNTTHYAYDDQQRLTAVTDPVGQVSSFTYVNDHLDSVTDPSGRTSRFEHDAQGNLIRVVFPDGSFKTFGYDSHHLMTSETDERGYSAVREYDAQGRIKRATRADGAVHTASHAQTVGLVDPESGLGSADHPSPPVRPSAVESRFTDGEGHTRSANTDRFGRLTRRTDPNGLTTSIERDENGNPVRTTRPDGSAVKRSFDDQGNLLTITEAFNGAVTRYTYDPQFNLVTAVTDPLSRTTAFHRDAQGNLTAIIDPLGHTTALDYNDAGQITRITDPNGLVTSYRYNTQGLPETVTETPPAGSIVRVTEFLYDAAGQPIHIAAPDGSTLDLAYDPRGRLIRVTDGLAQRIEYTYDASGNRTGTQTFDSGGTLTATLSQSFDALSRLTRIVQPHTSSLDSVQTFAYDRADNLIETLDGNGNVTSQNYDPGNRLIERLDPLLGSTAFAYDTNGRITRAAAPNGAETRYAIDPLGRVVSEQSPDRGPLGYSYDLAGNLKTLTDARGVTATYSYDTQNRLTEIAYPDPGENVTLGYDDCPFGIGRLCTALDESGETRYEYDAYGNITQITEIRDGTSTVQTYSYDAGHRIVSQTLPSGRTIIYGRDPLGRIQTISANLNGQIETVVNEIAYTATGRVKQRRYGNGLIETRQYDLQNRLLNATLQGLDQTSLLYDANGNVQGRNTSTDSHGYQYDPLDRLIEENNHGIETLFTYDPNGNRLSQTENAQSLIYDYLPESNQLSAIGNGPVLHDAAGNLIQDGQGRQYLYNEAGRLKEIQHNGQILAQYRYNAKGQRTEKTAGGVTTHYHYDLQGHLITETQADGTPIRHYLWQNDTPVTQIDRIGTTDTVAYLHTDHLDTPRRATGPAQSILWRWEGDAFGATQPESLGAAVNLRFPGQYFDEETGLSYNWNRYYDPSIGRYITSDPIGLAGGINTYLYAEGNPARFTDPQGLAANPLVAACGAGPNPACLAGIVLTGATVYYGAKAVSETADIIDLDTKRKEREGEQCPPIDPDVPDECELIRNSLILEEIRIKEDARGAPPGANQVQHAANIRARKMAWNRAVDDYNRKCPRKIGRRFTDV